MDLLCPTCGTEQERSAEATQRCVVCGLELASDVTPAATSPGLPSAGDPAAEPPAGTAEPAAAKLVAALPAKPHGASSVDFEELRSGARVFEWLAAMVPIYGLARLPRARLLSSSQKVIAGTVSLGLTLTLGAGVWAARGSGK